MLWYRQHTYWGNSKYIRLSDFMSIWYKVLVIEKAKFTYDLEFNDEEKSIKFYVIINSL